jgi:2-haloacid dehalogenase
VTARVLLFDVNGTLLDLGALGPAFTRLMGSAEPMGEWFARLLHGSLVADHTRRHRPFETIAVEALLVTAQRRGLDPGPDAIVEVVAGLRRLPPHPDVEPALERLAGQGLHLAVLTNGSADLVEEQLRNAGIARYFERVLSVDAIGRFKPAPETYLHAAAVLDVAVDEVLMVAAHDWDVAGARSVGMPGAFLARPGAIWGLPEGPPALVAPDLAVLAGMLGGEADHRAVH